MKKYFSMGFFLNLNSWSRRIVWEQFQNDSCSRKVRKIPFSLLFHYLNSSFENQIPPGDHLWHGMGRIPTVCTRELTTQVWAPRRRAVYVAQCSRSWKSMCENAQQSLDLKLILFWNKSLKIWLQKHHFEKIKKNIRKNVRSHTEVKLIAEPQQLTRVVIGVPTTPNTLSAQLFVTAIEDTTMLFISECHF